MSTLVCRHCVRHGDNIGSVKEKFRYHDCLNAMQLELRQEVAREASQQADSGKKIGALRMGVTGLLRLRDATFDSDEVLPSHPADMYIPTQQDVFEAAASSSLTEACQSVIQSSLRGMTAGEVRREMEIMGFDFSNYTSNPLSSIHTVLKRLDQAGKVRSSKNSAGKTIYEALSTE